MAGGVEKRVCALLACPNTAVKDGRWCNRHRYASARPEDAQLKPGEPAIGSTKPAKPGTPAGALVPTGKRTADEVRDEARRHAPAAMARLVHRMTHGSPSSEVQAAKTVLGLAGVQLTPPATVRHQHEPVPLPAGLSVADLVALVRGPATPQPVVVDVTPRPQQLVGAMAAGPASPPASPPPPLGPPNGSDSGQVVDFIDIPSYDAPDAPGPSGSAPDGPGLGKEA